MGFECRLRPSLDVRTLILPEAYDDCDGSVRILQTGVAHPSYIYVRPAAQYLMVIVLVQPYVI